MFLQNIQNLILVFVNTVLVVLAFLVFFIGILKGHLKRYIINLSKIRAKHILTSTLSIGICSFFGSGFLIYLPLIVVPFFQYINIKVFMISYFFFTILSSLIRYLEITTNYTLGGKYYSIFIKFWKVTILIICFIDLFLYSSCYKMLSFNFFNSAGNIIIEKCLYLFIMPCSLLFYKYINYFFEKVMHVVYVIIIALVLLIHLDCNIMVFNKSIYSLTDNLLTSCISFFISINTYDLFSYLPKVIKSNIKDIQKTKEGEEENLDFYIYSAWYSVATSLLNIIFCFLILSITSSIYYFHNSNVYSHIFFKDNYLLRYIYIYCITMITLNNQYGLAYTIYTLVKDLFKKYTKIIILVIFLLQAIFYEFLKMEHSFILYFIFNLVQIIIGIFFVKKIYSGN